MSGEASKDTIRIVLEHQDIANERELSRASALNYVEMAIEQSLKATLGQSFKEHIFQPIHNWCLKDASDKWREKFEAAQREYCKSCFKSDIKKWKSGCIGCKEGTATRCVNKDTLSSSTCVPFLPFKETSAYKDLMKDDAVYLRDVTLLTGKKDFDKAAQQIRTDIQKQEDLFKTWAKGEQSPDEGINEVFTAIDPKDEETGKMSKTEVNDIYERLFGNKTPWSDAANTGVAIARTNASSAQRCFARPASNKHHAAAPPQPTHARAPDSETAAARGVTTCGPCRSMQPCFDLERVFPKHLAAGKWRTEGMSEDNSVSRDNAALTNLPYDAPALKSPMLNAGDSSFLLQATVPCTAMCVCVVMLPNAEAAACLPPPVRSPVCSPGRGWH